MHSSGIEHKPPQDVGKRRGWLGHGLAVLLIVALGAMAWWLTHRGSATYPSAYRPGARPPAAGMRSDGAMLVTVGVATAEEGELPIVINALGTVTPVTQVVVRPQVSGVLTEVLFKEGQMVRKGQLLARIDAAPFEQSLAQVQGQRMRDEAQLAAARVTLRRYQQLWEQDSIARQDVDTQTALVKQLEGTVQSDKASEGSARINLGYTKITAPISGRIGLRAVDPGNMVTVGTTIGIATITQMVPINIKFSVPQDRVNDVIQAQRAGALPVHALDRSASQILASGTFVTLDNVIDTATGTLMGKALFANADGSLFPNQFVNVRLRLGETKGVLVPVSAVRTGPKGEYVYVVDDQQVAHMRAIRRGGETIEQVLIASGLTAGEVVVTEGGDRVHDGDKVQLASGVPTLKASAADAAAAPVSTSSAAYHRDEAQLSPQERAKVQAMSSQERRAYFEQRRVARDGSR